MTDRQRLVLREVEHYNALFCAGFRDAAQSCRALVRRGWVEEPAPGRFWITLAGAKALNP